MLIFFWVLIIYTFDLGFHTSFSRSNSYVNESEIRSNPSKSFGKLKESIIIDSHPWLWIKVGSTDNSNDFYVSVGSLYRNNKVNVEIREGKLGKLVSAEYDCLNSILSFENPKYNESTFSFADSIVREVKKECLERFIP